MHFTAKPESDAQIFSAPSERAADPYRGTPLGVEAAWWPNGLDLRAGPETAAQPMEL